MADAKYGRLFTQDDVAAMIFARTGEDVGVIREFINGCQTRFPADEPLFLIRGKDKAAPEAIDYYTDAAQNAGASGDLIAAVHQRCGEIEAWQEAHPGQVKVPD